MATLHYILSSHEKSNGMYSVRLRITHNRKPNYLPTSWEVFAKDWNKDSGFAREGKGNPSGKLMNHNLREYMNEISNKILDLERKNSNLTISHMMDQLQGKVSVDAMEVMQDYVEGFKEKGKLNNYDTAVSRMHNVQRFVNGRKLEKGEKSKRVLFEDINEMWLNRFKAWMEGAGSKNSSSGYAGKTVQVTMEFIRTIVLIGVRMGAVKKEENPFRDYRIKRAKEKKEKTPLVREEIDMIRSLLIDEKIDFWTYHTRNAWLYSLGYVGVRVSDVIMLRWKSIYQSTIRTIARKSNDFISINVQGEVQDIIKLYTPKKINPEGFVFPFYDYALKSNPDREMHNHIKYITKMMNRSLVKIAKACGITKHMHTHGARATYVQRAIDNGLSLYQIGKLLGHDDPRTTEEYVSHGFNLTLLNDLHKKAVGE